MPIACVTAVALISNAHMLASDWSTRCLLLTLIALVSVLPFGENLAEGVLHWVVP